MQELKGVSPIIATPFTNQGEVDYESYTNLIRTLAAGGCQGLTLFGIAGEYYKLSDDEARKMTELAVAECRRAGIPLIVSLTQHATEVAVRQARIMQEIGVEYLMVLPPFFMKPGAAALEYHIRSIANAVNLPLVVQYAPEQTGVSIAPAFFTKLNQELANVSYFKIECKPAGAYITSLLEGTGLKARIFLGNAGYQFIEGFDRGAIGLMPGCSMFDIYLRIYDLYMQGNRREADQIHQAAILPMLNHIRQNVEMIISFEKRILLRRGIIATDYCRHPSFTTDAYFDRLFDEYYELVSGYFQAPIQN